MEAGKRKASSSPRKGGPSLKRSRNSLSILVFTSEDDSGGCRDPILVVSHHWGVNDLIETGYGYLSAMMASEEHLYNTVLHNGGANEKLTQDRSRISNRILLGEVSSYSYLEETASAVTTWIRDLHAAAGTLSLNVEHASFARFKRIRVPDAVRIGREIRDD